MNKKSPERYMPKQYLKKMASFLICHDLFY